MLTTDTVQVTREEALELLDERLCEYARRLAFATVAKWEHEPGEAAWFDALTAEAEAEGEVKQARGALLAAVVCPPGVPLELAVPGCEGVVLRVEG
jgi:hypothetical protein